MSEQQQTPLTYEGILELFRQTWEQFQETRQQMQETDRKFLETRLQMQETDRRISPNERVSQTAVSGTRPCGGESRPTGGENQPGSFGSR